VTDGQTPHDQSRLYRESRGKNTLILCRSILADRIATKLRVYTRNLKLKRKSSATHQSRLLSR